METIKNFIEFLNLPCNRTWRHVSYEPENSQIFVDEDRLSYLGLMLRDLAHFIESQPFFFAVFTNDDVS